MRLGGPASRPVGPLLAEVRVLTDRGKEYIRWDNGTLACRHALTRGGRSTWLLNNPLQRTAFGRR